MRKMPAALVILLTAIVYYAGVVLTIGLAARFGPMPSVNPSGTALAQVLAVAIVAALVAIILLKRFGNTALPVALIVAAPSTADLLWSLFQHSDSLSAVSNATFVLVKDVLLLAFAPAAMTALISQIRAEAGSIQT